MTDAEVEEAVKVTPLSALAQRRLRESDAPRFKVYPAFLFDRDIAPDNG